MKSLALVAGGAIALGAIPAMLNPYYVTLILPAFAYGIALLGLNLLFGYTGLLSFGHALFLAIGAYTAAAVTTRLSIDVIEVWLLAAAVAAAAIAIPVGFLSVRYIKIFFGMLTLAFGMLFYSFLFKFYEITGGDSGIRVGRPRLLGMDFNASDKTSFLVGPFFYYSLALLLIAALIMWRIVHSPFGLHLKAIRENPKKAEYLGVQVRRYRFYAFLISAVYGGVSGVLLAVPTGLAEPEMAYWTHSSNLVFMLVLGGFANFFGPLLGAVSFIFIQDQLMSATEYWRFFLGVILALIVMFMPRGLMGLVANLVHLARPALAAPRSKTGASGSSAVKELATRKMS